MKGIMGTEVVFHIALLFLHFIIIFFLSENVTLCCRISDFIYKNCHNLLLVVECVWAMDRVHQLFYTCAKNTEKKFNEFKNHGAFYQQEIEWASVFSKFHFTGRVILQFLYVVQSVSSGEFKGAVGAAAPYWLIFFFQKSRPFPCIIRCVHLRQMTTKLINCLPSPLSKFLDPPLKVR